MSRRPTRRAVLLSGAALVLLRPDRALAAAPADVEVLNALLATEHAVIYDLSAAGATLPVGPRATVLAHWDEHRTRRDALTQRIQALRGKPVAAAAAYADPVAGADGRADIEAIERAAVQAYYGVIAVVSDAQARSLCGEAFVAECRHWALARRSAGLPGAPLPFVTGA